MKLLAITALGTAAATTSLGAAAPDMQPPKQIAPARDGNIAIQEELCAARKAGTVAAYDMFIARHPGHPLEPVARQERERLLKRQRESTPGAPGLLDTAQPPR